MTETPALPSDRARHRRPDAWLVLMAPALLTATLALAGCSLVPRATGLIDAGVVAQRLHQQLGLPMVFVPGITNTITLQDVLGTYTTQSVDQRILVIGFDSPDAVKQLTGNSTAAAHAGFTLLRRENVAVLYQRSAGPAVTDLTASMVSILDAAPRTLNTS